MAIGASEIAEIEKITWGPARYADLPAVHALMLAVAAEERESRVPALEDVQREFDDPWSDPATNTWLALAPESSAVAYARAIINPEPPAEPRAFLDAEVQPLDTAVLGVDSESPTGALGQYEGLGFVVFKDITVFQKAVKASDEHSHEICEGTEHGQ